MKKILTLLTLLTVVSLVFLSACGKSTPPTDTPTDTISTPGDVTVTTDKDVTEDTQVAGDVTGTTDTDVSLTKDVTVTLAEPSPTPVVLALAMQPCEVPPALEKNAKGKLQMKDHLLAKMGLTSPKSRC